MKYEDRYYKISRDRLIYLLWLEHQVEAKKQREINYLNRMNNLPEYELPPFRPRYHTLHRYAHRFVAYASVFHRNHNNQVVHLAMYHELVYQLPPAFLAFLSNDPLLQSRS